MQTVITKKVTESIKPIPKFTFNDVAVGEFFHFGMFLYLKIVDQIGHNVGKAFIFEGNAFIFEGNGTYIGTFSQGTTEVSQVKEIEINFVLKD